MWATHICLKDKWIRWRKDSWHPGSVSIFGQIIKDPYKTFRIWCNFILIGWERARAWGIAYEREKKGFIAYTSHFLLGSRLSLAKFQEVKHSVVCFDVDEVAARLLTVGEFYYYESRIFTLFLYESKYEGWYLCACTRICV